MLADANGTGSGGGTGDAGLTAGTDGEEVEGLIAAAGGGDSWTG